MSIEAVAVIIPAHDEEALVARCLTGVKSAAAAILPVLTLIVVVDDASHDRTSDVARSCLSQVSHVIAHRSRPHVGRARSLGVTKALENLGCSPESLWLAFTDADTFVYPDWLRRQLAWARAGYRGVAGIVQLPAHEREQNLRYETHYREGVGVTSHEHVHGANIGVSAEAYLEAGGFPDLRVGEDVGLWRRLVEAGVSVVSDPNLVVETSARRASRSSGGLATFLTQLST